ncbi:SAM-dependent methyltransferase [Pokkaliibacter plantistimulans]|uniref:SAM-dependent methyltransferase n=2 Tax=Pokkaliibacter plantistimulans TaxID=1635171 RepID=A0ABX5M3T5_9GAMM|nr:class I SAM-dependent methyltransferase [Pokkaliibacter plantistimulans]PXF32378.1 SAM-dependent methyltransferase [Pokkaliibacter plantistimulans]
MKCRHCAHPLHHNFIDLGFAPPSNAYLTKEQLHQPEKYFPLRVKVCEHCWLVQTEDYAAADTLFDQHYAYFSSISKGWLAHAQSYCDEVEKKLSLDHESFVVEVASNDGYLLRNMVAKSIPCLGIEPTESTAGVARSLGIPVLSAFFGEALAQKLTREGPQADLIIGNNVLAHVPDINDFCRGLATLLKPGGAITLEFPHLLELISLGQFDTIYHEHFSYLSLRAVSTILASAGLKVWNVDCLSTHGGSLRVWACHANDHRAVSANVAHMLEREALAGLGSLATYATFQQRADNIKNELLSYLLEQKRQGRTVVAYGAAAKGNTLLNYAGVKPDLLPYVCDAAPSKQGKYLPGSHIPIVAPDVLADVLPDVVLILPWNIKAEVMQQLSFLREVGTSFVTAVPMLEVL